MPESDSRSTRDVRRGTLIAIGLHLTLIALAVHLAACAPATSESAVADADLAVWEAGEPTLSIGVLEGAEEYEFGSVVGVVELDDGGLAVSDGGVGGVSIFDPEGDFVRRIGSFGEGPGEFGLPSRVYRHGPDSIAVLDQRRWAVSYFDLEGEWGRQAFASELSGEEIYPMDVFPVSRYVVDGVTDAVDRARVGAVVADLPAPRGESLVRMLKVARDGSMWVREVDGDSATASEWMVLGPDGRAVRWARLAPGFTPFQIDGDVVVGRRVGDYGVEYVERYELTRADDVRPVPDWFASPANDERAGSGDLPLSRDDLFAASLRSVKVIAGAQEMNYARRMSYTSDLSELDLDFESEMPEEIEFRMLSAGSRGWAMVVAHPDVPTLCTLGYGLDTPPGWGKGSVDCGTVDGTGVEPMYVVDESKAPADKGRMDGADRD